MITPRTDQPQVGRAYAVEVAAQRQACARAARIVADRSVDLDDCRELLEMLGLRDTGPSANAPADRRAPQ